MILLRHPGRKFPPLVFLLFPFLLLLTSCQSSVDGELRSVKVGLFQNNPIIFEDAAGQPDGLFVDLLNEIARREGWQVEYVAASLDECLRMLQSGQLDLMTSLAYSPQRNKFVDFSAETVWTQWGMAFVPLFSPIEQVSDLRGKKVGILRNGINGINFSTLLENQKISCQLEAFDSYDAIFAALEQHRIDAGIVNNVYGVKNSSFYRVQGTTILFSPEIPLFGVPKGRNRELLERIDFHLNRWKEDPRSIYYQALKRWLLSSSETRVVVPLWLYVCLSTVVSGFVLLLIWNYLLKRMVARKTLALQSSQEQLQLIIKGSNDAPWDWDMVSGSLYLSPQWWRQIGLLPEAAPVSRELWLQLLHPEDCGRVYRQFNGFLRHAHDSFEFEFRLRHVLGHYVPLLCRGIISRGPGGRPLRVTGSNMDLTDQKQAAESLYETSAILQAAMNNSPVGIAIVNAPGGHISYMNMVGREIFALPAEPDWNIRLQQQIRRQLYDLDGMPLALGEGIVGRALKEGESSSSEVLIRTAAGQELIVMTNIGPILDEQGGIQSAIVVFSDITDKKRSEEDHRKLAAQLQQAQKIESIGQLAGGVAHDFNNMLGVILGHAQMAQKKQAPGAPLKKHLDAICQAAQHSADLTRQLLTFARKQTVEPVAVDLNGKITGMLSMLQRLLGEQVQLNWLPQEDLWHTRIDPVQVDQIIVNLCVNARDALAGNGHIAIATANRTISESDPLLQEYDVSCGEYVQLTVSDDGCGISDDVRQNIFEPFFTTKQHGLGTGLGLATVYGAVQQNHGFIALDTAPGLGASFQIFLPRCLSEACRKAALQSRDTENGAETILLVEDEISLLQLSKSMLEDNGYKVLVAATPEKAISYAANYPAHIDLLISDLIMPGMNGMELSQKIDSLRPGIRKLFVSGYTADILSRHDIDDRDFHFLQKPVSYEVLSKKVRDIFAGAAC